MQIQTYFAQLQATVDQYAATNFVLEARVNYETRPGDQGYLKGIITFIDSSTLHFSEYLDQVSDVVEKLMYTYHYQDVENHLIFRYDNARHQPPISALEHKHLPNEVIEALTPTIDEVLAEIFSMTGWV